MKSFRLAAIAAGAVVAFSSALHAQSGEVVYYGQNGAHIAGTIKAFGELYPNIRVKAITGDTGQTQTRLASEKANPQGDVLYGDAEHFINHPELFKPYRSKHHASFPDWALIKVNGETYAYGYNIAIQVFVVNTNQMKVADAPKAWKDLSKPQYKGKFMVGNPALSGGGYYSFFQFLQMFGWNETENFIENARFLSSTNAVPANVGRGEIAFGLVEETKSWELAEQGFPVAVIYPEEGAVPTDLPPSEWSMD
jgi:iron(III) transport system substrate-binding protein